MLAHFVEALLQQMSGFKGLVWLQSRTIRRDLSECRGFILQCRLVFAQRAHLFTLDRAKIHFIIGRLRGQALNWAQVSSGARSKLLTKSLTDLTMGLH